MYILLGIIVCYFATSYNDIPVSHLKHKGRRQNSLAIVAAGCKWPLVRLQAVAGSCSSFSFIKLIFCHNNGFIHYETHIQLYSNNMYQYLIIQISLNWHSNIVAANSRSCSHMNFDVTPNQDQM